MIIHNKKDFRNSSFELMRMIAMFMIVLGHGMLALLQKSQNPFDLIDSSCWLIKSFTACGVNVFFLLTGYYVCNRSYKVSGILTLWVKTIFYSVTIYLIVSITTKSFVIKEFIGYMFPVLTKKYWFIQTYIALFFLCPFISAVLIRLSTLSLNYLVVLLILFFCIHETFFKVSLTLDQTQGYGIIWGGVMLIVGYCLRRNFEYIRKFSNSKCICIYILISVLIFVSNYLIVRFNIASGLNSRDKYYSYNSVPVFIQSVCFFSVFLKISDSNWVSHKINFLSKNILAVYLISGHPLMMFSVWKFLFDYNLCLLLILCFVLSLCIVLLCIFIDVFIEILIKKFFLNKFFRLDLPYKMIIPRLNK